MGDDTQRRRRLLIAALAGIVAVGAFALVFLQMSPAKSAPVAASATATAPAVVAAVDLNYGDQLSATNLTVIQYPASALPATGLYYVDTKALLGTPPWYSTVKLPRGQLLLATQVTQELAPTKLPPVTLQNGDVAMSIPYDESRDSGGFIQQGDYIDILVDDPGTKTVHYAFQGVHVLRVGDRAAQPSGASAAPVASASLLLVEIPREQAAALAFAIDQNYTIRYLIRPHDQQTQQALPNSGPVGQSNWLNVIAN